jgi:flagellar basal-body rod modification protein FlgD
VNAFTWDGKTAANGVAPDGTYTFQVDAVRGSSKLSAQSLGFGRVQSVTLDPSDTTLNTAGLGSLSLNAVKQIL